MKGTLQFENIYTQTIEADWLTQKNMQLDVLRTDLLHEFISGNKWFKLKYYLQDAQQKCFDTIATFGGAYSNHIIATAFACKYAGIKSVGIIRGERPPVLSDTLEQAMEAGMELDFVSRAMYNDKASIIQHFPNVYWVNEGGFGIRGAEGAAEILQYNEDPSAYTHIVCAVGTGTMMAGLVAASTQQQQVIGVSAMKGNFSLEEQVRSLLSTKDQTKDFYILQDYHFGGYARHPPELISYMNELWQQHKLPTDIVYTAKTFYAIAQMVTESIIPADSKILMIHSGGLQGNRSLPDKTLAF